MGSPLVWSCADSNVPRECSYLFVTLSSPGIHCKSDIILRLVPCSILRRVLCVPLDSGLARTAYLVSTSQLLTTDLGAPFSHLERLCRPAAGRALIPERRRLEAAYEILRLGNMR